MHLLDRVACLSNDSKKIMEMGIPTQAVPLLYSGCDKWHGPENALVTKFPLHHVLNLLKISQNI